MAPDEPKDVPPGPSAPPDKQPAAGDSAADDKKADAKAKADEAKDKAKAKAKADEAEEKAKAKAKADEAEDKAKADEAEEKAKAKAAKAKADEAEDKAKAKAKADEAKKKAEAALYEIPKAPPWYRTLRADPPAYMRLLLGGGFIALVFFLWWFATRGYDVQVRFNGRTSELLVEVKPSVDRIFQVTQLPSPGEVLSAFSGLWGELDLSEHLTMTLLRVLKGVGLAALFGIGLGILSASHRGVNSALLPLVIFLRSVPMGALIPLTIMLFGVEEPQKTRFIFLAIVPFVFSDTVKAISIVPDRYIETAQTLGASRFQIIRKVLVPLALPDILTSLRFQFGLALGYITLAEQINPKLGLGMLIESAQRQGPYENVHALLFVIASVAFMIDVVLRTLQRGAFTWRKDL